MGPHDPDSEYINMEKKIYEKVIEMLQKILRETRHQAEKDFCNFQLALHHLRCEQHEDAERLISSINDESLKDSYRNILFNLLYRRVVLVRS
jgi:HSP90 family molecular chaperone